MTTIQRPNTPLLDAARKEQEALARYEAEERERQAEWRKRVAAPDPWRAELERQARERRATCEQAAAETDVILEKLVAALVRYQDNAPDRNAVAVRIRNVVSNALRQWSPIQNNNAPIQDLLTELYKEPR